MSLCLMYITNRSDVAEIAQKYGVDRIWIDLETRGKEERQKKERQKNYDSVKSQHSVADIRSIKPHLTTSEMLVRINPWYDGSLAEIDSVIEAGADIIMLPYWKTPEEASNFIKAVNGRCKTTLLLETKEALECIDEVLAKGGFDEIHIGLNDLHLSYGMTFMFELLSDGTVEKLCDKFKAAKVPYGFGGIAKLGSGMLPAEKVVMEHYRLGSTRAILSRSFCDCAKITDIAEIERTFCENLKMLRAFEAALAGKTPEDFAQNKTKVASAVADVVTAIKRTRKCA